MQLSLLGGGAPAVDSAFRSIRRVWLDDRAWLDHQAGWVSGHRAVFDHLATRLSWRSTRRQMYDQVVDVPRLVASLPGDGPEPGVFTPIRRALQARYGDPFEKVHLNYYRDGRDSVASHRDRLEDRSDVIVAVVSFGEPRLFQVRPHGGGGIVESFRLGWGDLLVMGGTCQRDWEHGVPKRAAAGPRISTMFRRSRDTFAP